MQAWLLRKIVTIATKAEVHNDVIFVQLKQKLIGFFFTVRRTPTNLVAMVGCHGDMVTMAMVRSNLFPYFSEGIACKFSKFLSWNQNFSFRLFKFYESLFPWQQKNTSNFFVSNHNKLKFATRI